MRCGTSLGDSAEELLYEFHLGSVRLRVSVGTSAPKSSVRDSVERRVFMASNELRLHTEDFAPRMYEAKGRRLSCRAILGAEYCLNPADPIQKVNVFAPEAYFEGGTINGYDAATAPVFLPNSVGGYLPGPAEEPGIDPHNGGINSLFQALEHGYVVVSGGVRGRTSGKTSTEFFEGADSSYRGQDTGRMVGRAPAFVVDQKAIVRFVRLNAGVIPGDVEHMVTNGTSAGGALSALTGASGNVADYEPYLRAIGAAEGDDSVFASSCFCPIINLEHADAAYEWQFRGVAKWRRTKHKVVDGRITRVPIEGTMSEEQLQLSDQLAERFPAYVNSLGLVDVTAGSGATAGTVASAGTGASLTLNEDGGGTFANYVLGKVMASAQRELYLHENVAVELGKQAPSVEDVDAIRVESGKVVGIDWPAYVQTITRMKATPAFDALDLKSPENEEFGDESVDARHFSADRAALGFEDDATLVADPSVVRLMNPIEQVRPDMPTRHWRIRHGSFDRDTSLAISSILAVKLAMAGCDVDFRMPWGIPHAGDYQMDELFAWIDGLCRK